MKLKNYIILIITALVGTACTNDSQEINTEGKTSEQIAEIYQEQEIKKLYMDFSTLVPLKYSDYSIIPLQATYTKPKEGLDKLDIRKDNKVISQTWNLLFYNSQTQEQHLLDEKNEFEIIAYDVDTYPTKAIFYTIRDDKANNDSILDNRDFTALYISDRRGKNFRPISPTDAHLEFYYKNPKANELLFNATKNRLPTWYEIELNKPDSVRKIFADVFLNNLQKSIKERVSLVKVLKTERDLAKRNRIGKLNFGYADTLPQSNFLRIPIMSHQIAKDKYLGSYGYDYDETTQEIWNFLFYNFKNKTYHLLTNEELEIGSYNIENMKDEYSEGEFPGAAQPTFTDYFFYEVRKDVYNKDSLLNYKDPKYLYISDNQGNKFQQISPMNASVQHWQRIQVGTDKVLMYVLEDTNNDKKFDEKDESFWYEVALKSPKSLKKIFDNQFIKQIKTSFLKRKSVKKLNQKKE
jgi:hypothetical protein